MPASAVALENVTISGMAFSLSNGRATWDTAGNRWVLVIATADPGASEGSAAYPARGICPVPARSLTLLRRSW